MSNRLKFGKFVNYSRGGRRSTRRTKSKQSYPIHASIPARHKAKTRGTFARISFVFDRRKWRGLWCLLLTRPEKPFLLHLRRLSCSMGSPSVCGNWSECVLRICQHPRVTSFQSRPSTSAHRLLHTTRFIPLRIKSRVSTRVRLEFEGRPRTFVLRDRHARTRRSSVNFHLSLERAFRRCNTPIAVNWIYMV